MHYSKQKGEIILSPPDWIKEAETISQLIIEASKKIWDSCYPNYGHYPYYLREFSYDYLLNEAQKRIIDI